MATRYLGARSSSASRASALARKVTTPYNTQPNSPERPLLTSHQVTFEKDSQRQQRFNVEAIVFDNTAQAVLSLWEEASASAASWKPSETVLLISRPGYKEDRRASNIVVNAQTWVEVDPAMQDADWLREYARKLVKRDHVNLAFPEDGECGTSKMDGEDC